METVKKYYGVARDFVAKYTVEVTLVVALIVIGILVF